MTRRALGLRAWLREEEVARVRGEAERRAGRLGRRTGRRAWGTLVAVRLGLECGLRSAEICGVKVGDVGEVEGYGPVVRVRRGKGGSNGVVVMPVGLWETVGAYLGAYRAGAGVEEALIVARGGGGMGPKSLWKRMRGLLRAVLGEDRAGELQPVHCLRHTCGTRLYRATRDLRLVQEHLRHSDPKVTQVYADLCAEDRRAGVERAFGGVCRA